MRFIITLGIVLVSTSAFAFENDRFFVCEATDGLERLSDFEFHVDTGVVRIKGVNSPGSLWEIIYSEELKCTRKTTRGVTCERSLNHNFDNPNRPYEAANDSIRCVRSDGKPVIQLNGNSEINRFGDKEGFFTCGTLSKFNLLLKNCRVATDR